MPKSVLSRVHMVIGIIVLVAFLLTGQYMDRRLGHLTGMPDGPRSLYRSGHIYILYASLLNVLLGVYLIPAVARIARVLQYLGSLLLLATPVLFLYGFFVETPKALVERPMIREGIVWSLGGVLLHLIAGLASRTRQPVAPRPGANAAD